MSTLAEVSGVNYAKSISAPPQMIASSQDFGRVRHAYDSYTVGTGDDFGTSGIIDMMTIPKGARIINARLVTGAMGGACACSVGWKVSDDAVEAADDDGLIVSTVVSSASDTKMVGSAGGFEKTFSAPCLVQVAFTAASSSAAGKVVQVNIEYVVD